MLKKQSWVSSASKFIQLRQLSWGVLLLVAVLGLIRALLDPYPAHFLMYYEEARALWQSHSAYGPQASHPNLYFYSPTFTLFFVGPLTVFPLKVALFFYLTASISIFFYGLYRFIQCFPEIKPSYFLGFTILIAPHLFHCIPAHKLELSIVGIMLLSVSWIIDKRRWLESAAWISLVGNWKLQPLPALGLLGLLLIFVERRLRWSIAAASFFVFWSVLPFLVKPWDYMKTIHKTWMTSLNGYSRACFDYYDNIFSFFKNSLGLQMNYETAQLITGGFAIVFSGVLLLWVNCYKKAVSKSKDGSSSLWREAVLYTFALGMTYTTLFSPLQQVNAYILSVPLFFSLIWGAQRTNRLGWLWLSFIVFFIFSLSTSDFIPTAPRDMIRHASIKSVTSMVVLILVSVRAFQLNPAVRR